MARERAHRIFAELSEDLERTTANSFKRVLCPLCLQVYSEDAIDLEVPELTEEHIVPESLGGKLVTLSCKSCNSTHGSKLDSHLVQMMRSQDSFAGLGTLPLKGRIGIAGNQLPARFDVSDRTFRVGGSRPAVLDEIKHVFQEGRIESIDLNFSLGYIPGRAYLALLRIAYLAMFRELGYAYILSPAASVLREIISRSENSPADLRNLIAELKNILPVPRQPLQFVSLGDIGAVAVVITLLADSKRHYAVPMPDPRTSADNVLETLRNAITVLLASRPLA
jgi:hypothetical protein